MRSPEDRLWDTGDVVDSYGNYSFTVDVRDGDLFNPRQADKYREKFHPRHSGWCLKVLPRNESHLDNIRAKRAGGMLTMRCAVTLSKLDCDGMYKSEHQHLPPARLA